MSYVRSFSLRLALTYVGLFLLSIGLLVGSFYYFSVYRPHEDLKRQIRREALQLEQIYAVDGEAALIAALASRAAERGDRAAFHVFIGPDGELKAANIPTWPSERGEQWLDLDADIYTEGAEFDQHAFALDVGFDNGARLMVGRDAEDLEELRELLANGMVWLVGSSLVLGLLGGGLLSRAIGARLEKISQAAIQVMEGDLAERVPVDDSNDDFDRVSQTLNQMLDRIEELFASVRRVSDNVAHELRTPLARLLADVETLEAQYPDEANPEIARIGAEVRRLQRIFDSLLRISRIEAGRHALALDPITPSALLEDLKELYDPTVEELGGRIEIGNATSDPFRGDRDLLFQALCNLVDNAIKYGDPEPDIGLSACHKNGSACFSVTNRGAEISEQVLARASERFFRGENAGDKPGEGLGLPVVEAIARAHDGNLQLHHVNNLTEAMVCVPWRAVPAEPSYPG
ncbi:MAG: HAMP domain-containing histidine kinase [Porphyrobacter sp.]|nr:HAMP domain-containing histidine kinase [Porphyrobacter sp.]